jgi:hypothetical protein
VPYCAKSGRAVCPKSVVALDQRGSAAFGDVSN